MSRVRCSVNGLWHRVFARRDFTPVNVGSQRVGVLLSRAWSACPTNWSKNGRPWNSLVGLREMQVELVEREDDGGVDDDSNGPCLGSGVNDPCHFFGRGLSDGLPLC